MASEVLKLATFRGDASSVQALLTVASGHTYTVLSVTICETGNAAETFKLLIDDGGGGVGAVTHISISIKLLQLKQLLNIQVNL